MLNFTGSEMDIVRVWAENSEGSPFPQEINLLNRMKKYPRGNTFTAMKKEVEIIYHWAEKETAGHYGTEKYLLENEAMLLEKIEDYLDL
jgi:hypothetical protein